MVVLRLRSRTRAGATLIETLDEYADELREVGGRLSLSGAGEQLGAQLRRAGKLDLEGAVHIVPAAAVVGASTGEALRSASAWPGGRAGGSPP